MVCWCLVSQTVFYTCMLSVQTKDNFFKKKNINTVKVTKTVSLFRLNVVLSFSPSPITKKDP